MFNLVNFTCGDKKHLQIKRTFGPNNFGFKKILVKKKVCKDILRTKQNFGPKRCFVQKCLVYKSCGPRIVWSKKFLDHKKFGFRNFLNLLNLTSKSFFKWCHKRCQVQKNLDLNKFWIQKIRGPKKCWVWKNVGSKKISSPKSFCSQKMLGQKRFWVKKDFGSNKFCVPNNFVSQCNTNIFEYSKIRTLGTE